MNQMVSSNFKLNNLEEMMTKAKSPVETTISVTDKDCRNFEKIFDKTINANADTQIQEGKSIGEKQTINDVQVSNTLSNNDENWTEFKNILNEITEEANAETSLDLTLARDINEIITQLKEAIENATEIIEKDSEATADEELIVSEEVLVGVLEEKLPEVEVDTEEKSDSQNQDLNAKAQLSYEQILTFIEKESDNKFQNVDIKVEEEDSLEDLDFSSLDDIVEFSENIPDENVVSKSEENKPNDDLEKYIDDEIIKDLSVESISAESDFSAEQDLLQSQAPEEYAVKAMINQEVEVFDLKIDSTSNVQNSQQTPAKIVDVNPSRIIEQITKHLEGLQNNSKVNIVLNPESLGRVNIQLLTTKDGSLTAQFTVTTQEAKELLMKGLDGLKESLVAQGVGVDNVSVKISEGQKSEYNQDWTEQEGSRGGNKREGQSDKEEKQKGLFEKMMAQATEEENGNV